MKEEQLKFKILAIKKFGRGIENLKELLKTNLELAELENKKNDDF